VDSSSIETLETALSSLLSWSRLALVALAEKEPVGTPALKYVNRLSDFLFVAARHVNHRAEGQGGDVLWVPGKNR